MELEVPSREILERLTAAAQAIAPTVAIGTARQRDGGFVAVDYWYRLGQGGFLLPADGVPAPMVPDGTEARDVDASVLEAGRTRAAEAFLLDNEARRLVSVPLAGAAPAVRLWLALADAHAPTAAQLAAFAALASDHAGVLTRPPSAEARLARLTRLELAAELVSALLRVLDVREVIDRLSATAKRALPHDLLLLNLFSDDLSTFTVYARSDQGAGLGLVRPNPYPVAAIRAWTYSIVDDHLSHPMERDSPATKIGARSSLRYPIRFDDCVIGGVAFVAFTPNAFGAADVPIGARLAEHVASALSHFRLAERLAEEAKRSEELRARTTSLELLDALLSALPDTSDLGAAFERISELAAKVLPHDAAALLVHGADGGHERLYASRGFPTDPSRAVPTPDELLRRTDWDHDLFEDVTGMDGPLYRELTRLGYRSLLRVPIRLEGRIGGALSFAAHVSAAFTPADVQVARRIADRLSVILARDRVLEASRRADEATERAARLEARVHALTQELDARTGFRRVVGDSPSWRRILTQATQVAATQTTALLLGESGTGKEVIARFIHRASPRKDGPFVALNCAALPDHLLEAELFGYERGAFTGASQSKPGQLEQAAGGTLFLDEVGEMSLPAQAKFLRVLQEREFQRLGGTRVLRTDARVVAATNRDLQKAIANQQFRDDLYYRLNVFAIRLPPLRERRDDILPLTEAFLTEFGRTFAHPPAGLTREARQMLLAHHWPGNIRELRNLLERAAILCDGGLITGEHLALPAIAIVPPAKAAATALGDPVMAAPAPSAGDEGLDLATMERGRIEQALQQARFNKSKAAKTLGLTRRQLYIRMRRHGLEEN